MAESRNQSIHLWHYFGKIFNQIVYHHETNISIKSYMNNTIIYSNIFSKNIRKKILSEIHNKDDFLAFHVFLIWVNFVNQKTNISNFS